MSKRYAEMTEEQKEKNHARARQWRQDNSDKMRSISRKWYQANREKVRANTRQWQQANREKECARVRRWQKSNPEKTRAQTRKRRALKNGQAEHFTEYEWKLLCDQYGNHCIYPGCDKTDLSPDHVVPLSWGGKDTIDNIQPLCLSHNSSKGATYVDYRNREPIKVEQLSLFSIQVAA